MATRGKLFFKFMLFDCDHRWSLLIDDGKDAKIYSGQMPKLWCAYLDWKFQRKRAA